LYANEVREIIDNIKSQGNGVAAYISESLQSCGGQIVYPKNYLKLVYEAVRNNGGVCIADEVQVGLGRCGSHFWAFETQDVVPDIVTIAKPFGNGFPVAVVVTTQEIADSFTKTGVQYCELH
jgi:ethanolamine-phosphate phospho-lyase